MCLIYLINSKEVGVQ